MATSIYGRDDSVPSLKAVGASQNLGKANLKSNGHHMGTIASSPSSKFANYCDKVVEEKASSSVGSTKISNVINRENDKENTSMNTKNNPSVN